MRALWQLPERGLLAEQLRLLYGNVGVSVLPAVLLALLLVFTLQNDANRTALTLWCATVVLSKLYAAIDAKRRLAGDIDGATSKKLVARLALIHAIDGAAWGALAWVTLGTTTATGSIMVLAVLTGILGSSMSLLAPVLIAFFSFAVAMLVPVTSWMLMSGDSTYQVMSLAGMLYVVSLVGQARNSNLAALAAIRLRFENLDLIREADEARRSAEFADLAKTRFLAAASHDLRQPIHAQGLLLDVLSRTTLNPHQQQILHSARAAWQTSNHMLNTLLDFSRIEAGAVQPHAQVFYLQDLLDAIAHDLAPEAHAKGLAYRSRATTLTVESDAHLVEMVLRNLVSNAIRYTERGGLLVACRRRGDQVQVEVWDTGIGIAEADQPEIFHEFYRLGNPERDRNKGLGLGLAIAQSLADALDLRLSLSSRPGRGSVFRIMLPLTAARGDAVAAVRAPIGALPAKLRVLVIDDDEAVCEGMARLLESWGCQCDGATSIREASAIASVRTPSVIICAEHLPGQQSGAPAIAELRTLLKAHAPALIIADDVLPDRLPDRAPDRPRPTVAQGDLLLHRPVTPEQLYLALLKLLG